MSQNGAEFHGSISPERSRYRLLLEATDRLAVAKSLPEAFKELAPPVLDLTGGDLLNLSLHDPHRNLMLTQYWKKNQESGLFSAIPVDEAASGWAWKNQAAISISDIEREHRFPGIVPALLAHGIRSYTVIPMSTPASRFGALGLGKRIPEVLNKDDLEFLSRIAKLGALTLEKNRALRACEEQQSLVAISRELSCGLDQEKLLPAILSSLRGIKCYERAILSLLGEDEKTVHRYGDAQSGNITSTRRPLSHLINRSRCGRFRRTKFPLLPRTNCVRSKTLWRKQCTKQVSVLSAACL